MLFFLSLSDTKYFLDALKVIDDEEIFVDFGSSISPCVIRPVDEDGSYLDIYYPRDVKSSSRTMVSERVTFHYRRTYECSFKK